MMSSQNDTQVIEKNLDHLVNEFKEWQQAYSNLLFENIHLQGEAKELQKQQLRSDETAQQSRNDSRLLQEQIDKLHGILKTRCDLQDENRTLKLECGTLREDYKEQAQSWQIKAEGLKAKLEDAQKQHKQEILDLVESQNTQCAVDRANYDQELADRRREIAGLERNISDIEKERHSEIVKLRLEYDGKLLKLQKQSNRVKQTVAASSSSNQEIFRKKLQHAKSEYEREITNLKRTISDLEGQGSRSGIGNATKVGPHQLKMRKL